MSNRVRTISGLVLLIAIPTVYIVLLKPALIFNNVESTIAGLLQESIGPAALYRVKIDTPLHHLVRGDMGDVAVTGNQVRLQNGIVAERLHISLRGVKANLAAQRITDIRDDDFSVTISQADLNRYIAFCFPEIPDLSVKLQEGKLVVSTKQKVMLVGSRIMFDGTLEIEDGHKLMLRLHNMKAGKVRMPGSLRGKIEKKLNPVLSTSEWSMGTEFRRVAIHSGRIEVSGRVNPEDLTSLRIRSSR